MLDEAEQTDKEEDKIYGHNRGDELPKVKAKAKRKNQQVLEQMKTKKTELIY